MRSNTAVPWPISAATISNCPGGGGCTGGASSGSISGRAHARSRQGSGATARNPPSRPQATAHGGAAAAFQTTHGTEASTCKAAIRPCTSAASRAHKGGSSRPASASGAISSVTSGIATRLAAKPTSDTCWKKTIDSGARPMVATACVRRPARRDCPARARQPGGAAARSACAGSDATSKPTATNDSQKPACSSAQGSKAVTATAAASSTAGIGQRSPLPRSSTTMAIIHTVRCAGTPQPASSA